MEGDLAQVVHGNLVFVVDDLVEAALARIRVHKFLKISLIVGTHHHFVSVNINVLLHKWHWLGKNVEARAQQIDKEHLMVLHDAENSLVVVASAPWGEVNHNPRARMRLDGANGLTKREHIALVRLQLELGRQITVVDHIQNSVCLCLDLNLTKVHRLRTKLDVEAQRNTLAREFELVTACGAHLEVCTSNNVLDLGRVSDYDCVRSVGHEVGTLVT